MLKTDNIKVGSSKTIHGTWISRWYSPIFVERHSKYGKTK